MVPDGFSKDQMLYVRKNDIPPVSGKMPFPVSFFEKFEYFFKMPTFSRDDNPGYAPLVSK